MPGMKKVHPSISAAVTASGSTPSAADRKLKSSANFLDADAVVLTVWKKSLLFNCNGFTVYDRSGNLVFRVDNYMTCSGSKGEIVLMDAGGEPLLTIRRKKLSFADSWLVYDGETAVNPLLSVRKNVNILNNKCLAHVSSGGNGGRSIVYEIEGSYSQRSCVVYDENRMKVAEIRRKEAVGGVAFGVDVFRLVVGAKMDRSVAMAIVILLDQMFGSSKRISN